MRGRKPKPVAVKILEGHRGHRPLPNEPKHSPDLPKCPDHLSKAARAEWRRIVGELAKCPGLLNRTHRVALAAYCSHYALWVEASEKLQKNGLVVRTKSGNVIPNPYLGVLNTQSKHMHRYLIEFGMTPASNARVNMPPAVVEDAASEFDEPIRLARMGDVA